MQHHTVSVFDSETIASRIEFFQITGEVVDPLL
jgi:hypothetical protein